MNCTRHPARMQTETSLSQSTECHPISVFRMSRDRFGYHRALLIALYTKHIDLIELQAVSRPVHIH